MKKSDLFDFLTERDERLLRFLIFLSILMLTFSISAMAKNEVTEGIGDMGNGVAVARKQALDDTLHQLALQQNAHVITNQYNHADQALESGALIAPNPSNPTVTIVDEYPKDGLYFVKVKAEQSVPPPSLPLKNGLAPEAKKLSACYQHNNGGKRRRLLVTYFSVQNAAQASDMPHLALDLPAELSRRLDRYPALMSSAAERLNLLPGSQDTDSVAERMRQLGQQEGVQFIVAGQVRSTAVTGKRLWPVLFESDALKPQSLYYDGPFSTLLNSGLQYKAHQRNFTLTLWVYDALTGSRLTEHTLSAQATGEVAVKKAFGSEAFWQTPYGNVIHSILEQGTQRIAKDLACLPFATRIVALRDGKVILGAGSRAGLNVSDTFLLYKSAPGQAVRDFASGRQYGVEEVAAGEVTLIQVQPNMAVGLPNLSSSFVAEVGDYIRFVPRF